MRTVARVLIVLALVASGSWIIYQTLTRIWADHQATAGHASTEGLFAATLPDSNGTFQSVSQWRGKVTVVNFWATWCPPCREEMPELSQLHEKYRTRGLAIVGIATDDIDKIRQFAQEAGVGYPLLAGDLGAMELAAGLGNTKSVLPYTVILGRDGNIAAAYFGRLDMPTVEQALLPLLNTPG